MRIPFPFLGGMLVRPVHEGPDGRFPAWLNGPVTRRVQIGNAEPTQVRFDHGGGGRAGHAREGIDIDHAVVPRPGARYDGCDAQAGLGGDVKGKKVIFLEGLFEVGDLVVSYL